MKQCSYCGTKTEDSVTTCPGCGASSFSRICPNCGKVYESGGFCPNCGTSANAKPKTCPRCGNVYFTNACPNCGYNTMSSSQPNNAQQQNAQPHYTQPAAQAQPQKKGSCFWRGVLWFLFFPIMLIVTIWKSNRLSVPVKLILTLVVFGFLFVASEYSEPAGSGNTGLDAPLITAVPAEAETFTEVPPQVTEEPVSHVAAAPSGAVHAEPTAQPDEAPVTGTEAQ